MAWEYKAVMCPQGQELQIANNLGKEGWELATMLPAMAQASMLDTSPPIPSMAMIFKRQVHDGHKNGFVGFDLVSESRGIPEAS